MVKYMLGIVMAGAAALAPRSLSSDRELREQLKVCQQETADKQAAITKQSELLDTLVARLEAAHSALQAAKNAVHESKGHEGGGYVESATTLYDACFNHVALHEIPQKVVEYSSKWKILVGDTNPACVRALIEFREEHPEPRIENNRIVPLGETITAIHEQRVWGHEEPRP